jgi:hypothetical protein
MYGYRAAAIPEYFVSGGTGAMRRQYNNVKPFRELVSQVFDEPRLDISPPTRERGCDYK